MSGKKDDIRTEDESLGVLDAAASVETTGIGIIGGTAQVSVSVPIATADDDDLVDDEAVVGELLGEPADDELVDLDGIEIDETEIDEGIVEEAEEIPVAPGASAVPGRGEDLDLPAPAVAEPAAEESEQGGAVSAPKDDAARVAPRADVTLTAKRLGELSEASRESADLLTSDRLVERGRRPKPEPEGAWPHFLYAISAHTINIGDSKRARERKQLTARIATPLPGGARFVAVLSRKGGVGKTTVTTLLGMALADARDDRVVALDANPDRGTLADRIAHQGTKSVRDLARISADVHGYQDLSAIVGRDATRLDVVASDADPSISSAFGDADYRKVAEVAAHYYSVVLTDTGTGIVHSVMTETLDLADQVVIVAGLSVDEARLASETLTWLEANGRGELAREAIVVINKTVPGKPLVQESEIEKHFSSRVRHVVHLPYDPQIAAGGEIGFAELLPETRLAARELAALVAESLRTRAH